MKTLKAIILLGVFSLALISFSFVDAVTDWTVPAKYKSMKNPVNADKASLTLGKSLYNKHCKSCHGKEGYGDGPKADDLEGDLGDFSSAEFHKQSDGSIYYKTTFGKDDMPKFEKKISEDEDRWHIVNYIRTMK